MIAGHLKDVCKAGQGAATCRYITMNASGWLCAKLDPSLKPMIDARIATMRAKGDNCEGVTDLEERSKGIVCDGAGVTIVEMPGSTGGR